MLHASGISHSQFRVTDVTEQLKPEQKESDNFKFQIVYLVPILASLLFGLVCAYLLMPQQSEAIPVTPIPESTPGAPLGNALYFVVLVAISAVGDGGAPLPGFGKKNFRCALRRRGSGSRPILAPRLPALRSVAQGCRH